MVWVHLDFGLGSSVLSGCLLSVPVVVPRRAALRAPEHHHRHRPPSSLHSLCLQCGRPPSPPPPVGAHPPFRLPLYNLTWLHLTWLRLTLLRVQPSLSYNWMQPSLSYNWMQPSLSYNLAPESSPTRRRRVGTCCTRHHALLAQSVLAGASYAATLAPATQGCSHQVHAAADASTTATPCFLPRANPPTHRVAAVATSAPSTLAVVGRSGHHHPTTTPWGHSPRGTSPILTSRCHHVPCKNPPCAINACHYRPR